MALPDGDPPDLIPKRTNLALMTNPERQAHRKRQRARSAHAANLRAKKVPEGTPE
jgi:hypothetical protein